MKKFLIAGILIILSVLILYKDLAFSNKAFNPSDIRQYRNSAQVATDFLKKNPEVDNVLWNPNMFAGMPNYAISYNGNIYFIDYLLNQLFFGLSSPIIYSVYFGFLIFSLIYSINKDWQIALCFGLLSVFLPNYISLFEAGHNSKAHTSMLFPGLLLGFYLTLRNKTWQSALLFSLFTAFSFRTSHPQIIYYALLNLLAFGLYYLFGKKSEDDLKSKLNVSAYFMLAIVLAVALYALQFMPMQEYVKETIRGGGGLNTSAGSTGLSYDYANSWSLHPIEMLMQLLNPSFFGLADTKYGFAAHYWGWMPFTSTSYYLGVMLIPFAVLAIWNHYREFLVRGLLLSMAVAMIIAFGKHNFIPYLNELMLDYIPMYNKFRAPNVAMSFVQVILLVFASMGINDFILHRSEQFKKLAIAIASCLGILLIASLFSDSYTYLKEGEAERYGAQISQLISERKELTSNSNFLAMTWLVISFILSYLLKTDKIKRNVFIILIATISLFDLYKFDQGYFKKLVPKRNYESQFQLSNESEKFLMQDKSTFRVLPMGQLFDDARWSYYFENIGGYHAAKLSRFQTLIERAKLNAMPNLEVVNLLNGKYLLIQAVDQKNLQQIKITFSQMGFIYQHLDSKTGVLTFENPYRAERVFKADSVIIMPDEVHQLEWVLNPEFDWKKSVPVNMAGSHRRQNLEMNWQLEHYDVHRQEYRIELKEESLVSFSEIYYPYGWHAYIDDQPTDIYQSHFALKSLLIPAGNHHVRFEFQPEIVNTASIISHTARWIYISLIALCVFSFRETLMSRLKRK